MKGNERDKKCTRMVLTVCIALLNMLLLMPHIGLSASDTGGIVPMDRNEGPRPLLSNEWVNVTTSINPGILSLASMCYDSESDRIVLFGGMKYNGSMSSETWAYDFDINTWTNMSPSASPAPRQHPAMTYDIESDRIILFGGYDNGITYNDTWVYNYNNNTWTNVSPLNSPQSRYHPGIAYDSKSYRIILFSGEDSGYNDTWAYDYNNNTWTNMMPPFSPIGRIDPKMAYDSKADRVVMFGGGLGSIGSNNSWNDTWSYDYENNTWTEMHPTAPPVPRIHTSSMIYDSLIGKMILFGGFTTQPDQLLNDTWSYDLRTNTWEEMNLSNRPSARSRHAMAYDEATGTIVMYGGADDMMFLNETWIYQTDPSPPVVVGTVPANGTKDVSINLTIAITFSRAMDRTATEGEVSVLPSITWNATWSMHNKVLILIPLEDLLSGATYTISVSKNATSANGIGLEKEYVFVFATAPVTVLPGGGQEMVVFIITITTITATVAVLLWGEWLLYAFAALLVPLYMRVRRDKVLENFLRGRIYEYVRQHPGAHFRMVISGVKLSIGAVRYHLKVLENTGMIKSERKLNMKRFYTTEVDEDDGKRFQPLQRMILSVLRRQSNISTFRKHSGLSVDAIADTLNESHQVVMYHLRELCRKETVMPRKTSAGVRYYYMKAKEVNSKRTI